MLEIGKKIRLLRQKKNWSQADIAVKLGISIAAFSKIEKDQTDVSLSRLHQIADALEISIADLILTPQERSKAEENELEKARETISANAVKIIHLQEYIITLYEKLYQTNEDVVNR